MNKKFNLVLKIIAILITLGLIGYATLFALFIFGPDVRSYFNQIVFESNTWKNPVEINTRQKMAKSLFLKYKLIGMSRNEIDTILGRPPKTSYFRDFDYVYYLGPEKGLGIDSEWLCIKFKNDIVSDAQVLTD